MWPSRTEQRFSLEHGCQPLQSWKAKWPLGLDMLSRAVKRSEDMQMLRFFVEVAEESGSTFEQHLLGSRGVNTVDPRNIQAILSTKSEDYCLGVRILSFTPLLGSGIFTQDGTAWKHSRELFGPQFAYNNLQNFEQVKGHVQDLINSVPEDGIVDLQPLCFKLSLDNTMSLIFGDSVSAMDWGQESEFEKAFDIAQDYITRRARLGPYYWFLNGKKFRDACKTCHHFVDKAVARALATSTRTNRSTGEDENNDGKVGHALIDFLAQQMKEPQIIRDQCMNLLLAGRDTTGCCLQWAFRLLARHQHVLGRLRTEIEQTLGLGADAHPPTRDDLKKMTYLNLVTKEVLRLYPSVPANSRQATRLTTLPVGGGPDGMSPVLVRPGETVAYCVYAMHRRKDIYGEDADQFRPERWEGDGLKDVGFAYLPFNGGPRQCLGQDLALMQVSYTVARMVQVFPKMEVPRTEPKVEVGMEKQNLTLVVSSADGCVVSLRS
ncbi:cytochrome P450 [Ilyonectria robusta]